MGNTSLSAQYNTPTYAVNFNPLDAKVSMVGGKVRVEVYRTGPGDPDIEAEFTVTATPKVVSSDTPLLTYTGHIIIRTSCNIGDAKIGSLLWADRNVKATDSGVLSKGGIYTFAQAHDHCATFGADRHYSGTLATGWRLPANSEQVSIIENSICFSKQRAFIVSDDKTAGTVGCWFPRDGQESSQVGTYWSSTSAPDVNGQKTALVLTVKNYTAWARSSSFLPTGNFVRCVRQD